METQSVIALARLLDELFPGTNWPYVCEVEVRPRDHPDYPMIYGSLTLLGRAIAVVR